MAAIFVNAGSLAIANVTFTNNPGGGSGGSVLSGFFSGAAGAAAAWGSSASTIAGNGGGGGGSSGGEGTNGPSNGSEDGAGGGKLAPGREGWRRRIAAGGFGAVAVELSIAAPAVRLVGAEGQTRRLVAARRGWRGYLHAQCTRLLTNTTFISNNAIGGTSQSAAAPARQGGALYVSSTASGVTPPPYPYSVSIRPLVPVQYRV